MKTMGLNDRIKLFYNGMNGKVYEYFQLEDFAYELLDFEWIDINGGGCEFDLQMVIRYYYDLELTEDPNVTLGKLRASRASLAQNNIKLKKYQNVLLN